MISPVTLAAGLLMGFASSLHCAGMCGSIGSALTLTTHPAADPATRARMLLLTQAGRVLAYAAAGGILGTFGSALAGAFDQAAAYRMLQWASAVTLGWIGLSTARLVPSLAAFDRLAAPVGTAVMTLTSRHPGLGAGAPLAVGIAWGFMPCAMVYGALFTAMLTGTGAGGATMMLGFGLGTIPAAAALARHRSRHHRLRRAFGADRSRGRHPLPARPLTIQSDTGHLWRSGARLAAPLSPRRGRA